MSPGKNTVNPLKIKLLPKKKMDHILDLKNEKEPLYTEYLDKKGEKVIYAAVRALKGVTILCDPHHLPFRNDVFDLTWCSEVIQHQNYQRAILSEIKRVSKSYIVTYCCPDNLDFFEDEDNKIVLLEEPTYQLQDGTRIITNQKFDLPVKFDVLDRKRKLKKDFFGISKVQEKDVLAAKFYATIRWILSRGILDREN